MPAVYAYSFVEDMPSASAVKKIVKYCNISRAEPIIFVEGFPSVMGGYGKIKKNARKYIDMTRKNIIIISIVDLDTGPCAPSLIEDWFDCSPQSLPEKLIFRVAVREIESWLMADYREIASFLGIAVANFSKSPDDLDDPKNRLFTILKKKGHKKWHREMLPEGNAHIGPLYNEKLKDFITKKWNPERAAKNSPSLASTIKAIQRV